MQFAGDFETHFTLRLSDVGAGATALGAWAAARGLKFTHIVLARGETPSQPMLTRGGRGVLADEVEAARRVGAELAAAGFAVARAKIEAAPWNADVPQTAAEAAAHPPERHFEHHVKVLLPDGDAAVPALAEVAQAHGAHVSRNARRARADGRHERFVTQRCHRVGQPEARRRLAALLGDLTGARYDVLEHEEEFVVFDSNVHLDAGWILAAKGVSP